PASVVKELIENALDAGATAIHVEVAGGGVDLVRVSDNGGGMSRVDAPLSLQRFSTSKLRRLADLADLRTLGFRGEALAAITAVGRVTLLTRTAAEMEGTRVVVAGGQVRVEPAASPAGCSVAVADLFHSVPARRKFLKSPRREAELCQQAVVRYALAHPEVAFKLSIDGRERLVASPSSPQERLALAVGREAAGEMLPLAWEAGDLRLRGLIGSPAVGRSRRDGQFFFLNRRPIRSGLLAVMLERPYAGRLPPGRYPLAAIQIEIDPALVDVNVHPRKAEVRFAQERAIYGALSQAVSSALAPFPVEETLGTPGWPFPETPSAPPQVAEGGVDYAAALEGRAEALGQVRNAYVVARTFGGLIIVDQHAGHEAILVEQLLAGAEPRPLPRPARVDLTPREAELLAAHLPTLADLGIELELFGRHSFLVRALPRVLAGQEVSELLADLLAELAGGRNLDPDEQRERLANKAACRAAVKAGDLLAAEEQQALVDQLLAAWSPSTCPHGRPVLFALSVEEMERRFLRR
ncbi:MAG: DNA mismatch repair endonuclease MutL, partial [Anaerolineae bacterium]